MEEDEYRVPPVGLERKEENNKEGRVQQLDQEEQ